MLKIFLYNDERTYIQYFDDTEQQTKIFKQHVYTISIPLNGLERGKYNIGIEYHNSDSETDSKNGLFNTVYWIEIK